MKNKIILSILLLIIGISGCKKNGHRYPEDPGVTEKTSMERLTNKWWKLKQTFVNGKDYTDTVENTIGEFQIYFSTSMDRDWYLGTFTSLIKPNGVAIIWDINEELENIGISEHHTKNTTYTYVPMHYPTGSSNDGIKKVLKLTETELKITSYNQNADTVVTNIFAL